MSFPVTAVHDFLLMPLGEVKALADFSAKTTFLTCSLKGLKKKDSDQHFRQAYQEKLRIARLLFDYKIALKIYHKTTVNINKKILFVNFLNVTSRSSSSIAISLLKVLGK